MSFLINKQKQHIAYTKIKGKKPGIIFIHGYNSNMQGEKAKHIEKYAKLKKLEFIKFDCRGHGKSFGNLEDFVISDWKNDLLNIIDKVTSGPQIIIGSSMGGWLAFLLGKLRPTKIIGLIGLAAAPDFTKNLYKELPKKNRIEISKKGITKIKKWGFKYIFKKNFFIDGKKNFIINKNYSFKKPIILLHGSKDDVVSIKSAKKILNNISNNKIQLRILKNSDHRLSKKSDLKNITNAINYMVDIK